MLTFSNPTPNYQVGGSLPFNAPTYVKRQADEALFQGLLKGEFCYVFNARQMGKSSLRVQATHRLQLEGIRCGVIDITAIGTQEITPEQWYASIAGFLSKKFQLEVNLPHWWRDRSHLSYINRLSEFFDSILLRQISEPIVIFIDEIDSVLSLKFSTDDFFALIRACYNRRAEQPEYNRLTFALFGVATPSDLISDRTRTPFNIGQPIELRGIKRSEATPLLAGLTAFLDPKVALEEILFWTGGQPFLTQKLCQLIVQNPLNSNDLETQIDRFVQTYIIDRWESQDEPEHLKTIRDRLLYCEQRSGRLLGLYQKILLSSLEADDVGISIDDSAEQTELILTGLIEKRDCYLRVKNLIYQEVFNLDWVAKQLANLRPYSQSINAWIVSGYSDRSWLLRGQALQDVLAWSLGKSLSSTDYQYLAASQELEREEVQKTLEAERLKEVESRLKLERRRSIEQRHNLRRQRLMLGILSIVMLVAIALGLIAYYQYQQTAIGELKAIALSSEALSASNKWFEALLQAIKAKESVLYRNGIDANLKTEVDLALQRAVLNVQQSNRLDGHTAAVLAVDFSPDGKAIATAGVDSTIKLWNPNGTLIQTLKGHQSVIRALKFSPDGELLASAADDKTIRLWKRDGTLLKVIPSEIAGIWGLDFSPDSSTLAVAGSLSIVELWGRDGRLLKTFQGKAGGMRDLKFSPDGTLIATGNADNTISLWHTNGIRHQVFSGHDAPVQGITFSPDGEILVSASADKTIKLWRRDGTLLNTLHGHDTVIWGIAFSPDGTMFASSSADKTLKLWSRDGTLLNTFYGHEAAVWDVAFSPDSKTFASAGADATTILWKSQSDFQRKIYGFTGISGRLVFSPNGNVIALAEADKTVKLRNADGTAIRTIKAHNAAVIDVNFSPDSQIVVSAGEDKTVKLWRLDGSLVRTLRGQTSAVLSVVWNPKMPLIASSGTDGAIWMWEPDGKVIKTWKGHEASIWSLDFSPDGQILASASNDKTIRLWSREGKLLHTLKGHQAAVWKVAFSPDGELLATVSADSTVKLWQKDGTLLKTLTGHKAAVWGIAFSPDGQFLATGSIDETVKLWRRDGTLLITLNGHRSGVRSLNFHPYRPILASAGDDQTIILWNLEPILRLNPLRYGCNWIRDYLQTYPQIEKNNALCKS